MLNFNSLTINNSILYQRSKVLPNIFDHYILLPWTHELTNSEFFLLRQKQISMLNGPVFYATANALCCALRVLTYFVSDAYLIWNE